MSAKISLHTSNHVGAVRKCHLGRDHWHRTPLRPTEIWWERRYGTYKTCWC